jgi:hypothetical protein
MKKIFLVLIFIPLFLTAHIQDERLFKTLKVPAAAVLVLDRSGSMMCEVSSPEKIVTLKNRSSWSPGPSTTLVGWYDSTLTSYQNMNNLNGDDADGDWILRIEWQEYGRWVGSSSLSLSWILRVRDASGWHAYTGGSYTWTGGSGLNVKSDTIAVTGLGNVQDVLCYVDITTGDGLKIDNVGISLIHTPGPGAPSNRIESALLVIHSLLDVNMDGLVDGNDEFPIKLGQGFFDDAESRVGEGQYYYNADDHGITSNCGGFNPRNNPQRWNQVTKTWVDDLTGWKYLNTDTIGSTPATIWNNVNTTEVTGSTPTGILVDSAVSYINRYRSDHPGLWCMKYSVIVVTDGIPNSPRGRCTKTSLKNQNNDSDKREGAKDLVRASYLAFHGDNNGDGKPDSIQVYTVGFGTDITDTAANVLNWAARWGGTYVDSSLMAGNPMAVDPRSGCSTADPRKNFLDGYAYIAEDATALSAALVSIFMGIECQWSQSYTSAEVTSVEEEFLSTEYQSRLYVASFLPDSTPIWDGDLRALKMVAGKINLTNIPDSILIWSAGDTVAQSDADSRPIYGINSSGIMLPFDTFNFDNTDLDVTPTDVFNVIDCVRDGWTDDSLGELGDIFHSSPLRIQSPNYFFEDQGWDSFYNVMSRKRSPLIYAGGNDGMLHVFADTVYGQGGKGGHEIAGIIPMNFVSKVKNMLTAHDYFVDGDPMAADVWFPAGDDDSTKEWYEWHTILIATQGEGGKSFTAFDVTDPLNETPHPEYYFDFKFDAWQSDTLGKILGYTTSTPIIYKVGTNWLGHTGKVIDRFYGFVGGGQFPDPMDLSLVDSISGGTINGNVIIAFDVWKAATMGIDSNIMFIPPAGASMDYPFVASAAAININPEYGNRYDFLFIPDAAGQLWFVDLRLPNPADWSARKIFQPPLPASSDSAEVYNWHPAFYRPLIWKDPAYGGYWIAYGTGNRSDIFEESGERFYAIHYSSVEIGDTCYYESDLGEPGYPTSHGWMLELTHDREKVVTPAIYFQDSLEFYTFSPGGGTDVGPCDIGGTGSVARSYSFHIRTGAGNAAGVAVGSGMPQPPSYSFSISGEGKKVIQSGGEIEVKDIGSFMSFRQHILWKDEDRD